NPDAKRVMLNLVDGRSASRLIGFGRRGASRADGSGWRRPRSAGVATRVGRGHDRAVRRRTARGRGGPGPERGRKGRGGGRRAGGGGAAGGGGGGGGGASTLAVDDPALGQVVGGDLDRDPVAGDDPDEVLPHLAGDVRQDAMAALELDHELGVGQGLDD